MAIEISALSPEDLGKVVKVARTHGWHDGSEIVTLLVELGFSGDDRSLARVEAEFFLRAKVAREVWYQSLRRLRGTVRKLASLVGGTVVVPRLRRCNNATLASPMVVGSLREQAAHFNTTALLELFIESHVADARRGRSRIPKREWKAAMLARPEWSVKKLLEVAGFDHKTFSAMPLKTVEDIGERLFVFMRLTEMPDWEQYGALLVALNSCLESLAGRSRLMGGLDYSPGESAIRTGTPAFFDLARRPKRLPNQVANAVLASFQQLPRPFSNADRRFFRQAMEEAVGRHSVALQGAGSDEARRAHVAAVLVDLVAGLEGRHAFVERCCHIFWREYMEHVGAMQRRVVDDLLASMGAFHEPHCVVLVEGPSDEKYVARLVELLKGDATATVSVKQCGGKTEIVRAYRILLNTIGGRTALCALFDRDAAREAAEVARLARGRQWDHVHALDVGEIEDAIVPEAHAKAARRLFGARLSVTALKRPPVVAQLATALWKRRQVQFDKVSHAVEVTGTLAPELVAGELRDFVARAVAAANSIEEIVTRVARRPHPDPPVTRLLERLRNSRVE